MWCCWKLNEITHFVHLFFDISHSLNSFEKPAHFLYIVKALVHHRHVIMLKTASVIWLNWLLCCFSEIKYDNLWILGTFTLTAFPSHCSIYCLTLPKVIKCIRFSSLRVFLWSVYPNILEIKSFIFCFGFYIWQLCWLF